MSATRNAIAYGFMTGWTESLPENIDALSNKIDEFITSYPPRTFNYTESIAKELDGLICEIDQYMNLALMLKRMSSHEELVEELAKSIEIPQHDALLAKLDALNLKITKWRALVSPQLLHACLPVYLPDNLLATELLENAKKEFGQIKLDIARHRLDIDESYSYDEKNKRGGEVAFWKNIAKLNELNREIDYFNALSGQLRDLLDEEKAFGVLSGENKEAALRAILTAESIYNDLNQSIVSTRKAAMDKSAAHAVAKMAVEVLKESKKRKRAEFESESRDYDADSDEDFSSHDSDDSFSRDTLRQSVEMTTFGRSAKRSRVEEKNGSANKQSPGHF